MTSLILNILKEATDNKWPYPKTFESLKKAGLESYEIQLENEYHGLFITNCDETFSHNSLKDYKPLKSSKTFSKQGIQAAIIRHIQEQTDYVDFLSDIASQGVSHYKVDMKERTVTYFNHDESKWHQEIVPKIE